MGRRFELPPDMTSSACVTASRRWDAPHTTGSGPVEELDELIAILVNYGGFSSHSCQLGKISSRMGAGGKMK
jgi:hypothetical protein